MHSCCLQGEPCLVTSAFPEPAEVLRVPLCEPRFHCFVSHLPIQDLQPLQSLFGLFLGVTREGLACALKQALFTTALLLWLCSLASVLFVRPFGFHEWEQLCADHWGATFTTVHSPPSRGCCLRAIRGPPGCLNSTVLCTSRSGVTDTLPVLHNYLSSYQSNIVCTHWLTEILVKYFACSPSSSSPVDTMVSAKRQQWHLLAKGSIFIHS